MTDAASGDPTPDEAWEQWQAEVDDVVDYRALFNEVTQNQPDPIPNDQLGIYNQDDYDEYDEVQDRTTFIAFTATVGQIEAWSKIIRSEAEDNGYGQCGFGYSEWFPNFLEPLLDYMDRLAAYERKRGQ